MPAHAPGASREADELVAALLAKRPDERVPTATELVRLLGARAGIKATGSHHHVAVGAVGEIASTTTLGGAASAVPTNAGASRGARWPIVAAAALALGGGALALVLFRSSSSASNSTAAVPSPPAAVVDAGPQSPSPAAGVAVLDAGLVDAGPVDAIAVDAGAIDAAERARPSGGRRPKPGLASPPPQPSPPELIEDL